MEKMIAACGLDCAKCNAYLASKNNDNALRKTTAEEWTKSFVFPFTQEMINCHGCHATDGVQVGHCSECEIRACTLEKNVPHCAACGDYPCASVTSFHANCPEAAENLKTLRN